MVDGGGLGLIGWMKCYTESFLHLILFDADSKRFVDSLLSVSGLLGDSVSLLSRVWEPSDFLPGVTYYGPKSSDLSFSLCHQHLTGQSPHSRALSVDQLANPDALHSLWLPLIVVIHF